MSQRNAEARRASADRIRGLSARLARAALEVAEEVSAICAGPVDEAEMWLLIPEIAHLQMSLAWLEEVVHEAERDGRWAGLNSRRPVLRIVP